MIIEIEKLLKAKEIELAMVQIQHESLIGGMDELINNFDGLEFKANKHFWSAFGSLEKWQKTLTREIKDLQSMLEKAKDVQEKLDQLTK